MCKLCAQTHNVFLMAQTCFSVWQSLFMSNSTLSMLQGFWPLLTTTQWSEVTLPLVHAIAAKQRQDAVRLVSYAYSSIQPDRLASLTGTNPQEALQRIVQSPSLYALTQTRSIPPLHCDCGVGS